MKYLLTVAKSTWLTDTMPVKRFMALSSIGRMARKMFSTSAGRMPCRICEMNACACVCV